MAHQLRISAWAIRNPSPVSLLFIALVIAGAVAYFMLPVKQFPNVEFPAVAVTAALAGAAPDEMESQVTRPIENSLFSLPNIDAMTSTVNEGVSTTLIQFQIGEDLIKATEDVKARVEQVRNQLPRELEPPLVQRLEFDSQPIITYAVAAPQMSVVELSWYIDDTVSRRLQGVAGVGSISRFGGLNREVNIVLDPVRMAAQGVTAPQINNALNSVTVDVPGGRATIGGREQTMRVLGAATTIEDVRNLTIPVGGRQIRLTDVAEVGDGATELRRFARLDGRPVVGFELIKTKEASDVKTEDAVDEMLARMFTDRPLSRWEKMVRQVKGFFIKDPAKLGPEFHPAEIRGVQTTKIFSLVKETRDSFHATMTAMLEGMVLASLVVLLFLRDWRATTVTAIAMPVSLLPTFAAMILFGFSLNIVTLLALTLVIGILVDDAIVEIENIEKRVHTGMRPYEASLEGADQIGMAVVATTFAIVAVFTPVSFMPGIPGQFFKEFGLTVSVAVLFSLVVARLLTPLLAAYFLKPKPARARTPLPRVYIKTLEWALDHRIVASILGAALFFGSIALAAISLPVGLTPETDTDYFQINVEAPPGATLAETFRVTQQVEEILKARSDIAGVFMQVGAASGTSTTGFIATAAGSNRATVTAILDSEHELKVRVIRDQLRSKLQAIPDARVSFSNTSFGGGGAQMILTGDDSRSLNLAALRLQQEMRTLDKLIGAPRDGAPPSGPELIIRPKHEEAARLGVTAAAIAQTARVATSGDVDANVPKFTDGPRRLPIRVRLPASVRTDLATIRNLQVPTAMGGMTSLESVADIDFQAGSPQIERFDRKRQVTVQADLVGGAQLGDAQAAISNLPIMKNLPEGVAPASAGEAQALNQLMGGFIVAFTSAIFLVYGVMVLLFRSFFKPVTILSALPLALVGGVIGLVIMRLQLDMPSLIGFLMLMGLAAKNSILLIEYAIEREREGKPQRDAIMEACRERARPIVMTSLAMMAGMLPTALALGAGSEFRQPMAVAVIGGLITSTLLSLVLVPVVYEIIDDFEAWLKPKFGRLVTPREAPPEAGAPI